MAYNHASAFFLIALIFFATANPLAHGQLIPLPGLLPNLTVNGFLCCTPTGNCVPGSPPVAGALVNLTCPGLLGNIVTVGQAITTTNGSYSISVNLGRLVNPLALFIPPGCTVKVSLPLNQTICSVLSSVNGTLVGIVGPIALLLNQLVATVLGLLFVSI